VRPPGRLTLLAFLLFVPLALAAARPAGADDALWVLLKSGRQVVLVRHGVTTAGVGDPPGFTLNDCATQRNLTEAGRADARRLGDAFRSHGVPVGRVLSSPWCRCLETGRLAFGTAEPWWPLGNLFGRPENRADQVRELQSLAGERQAGGNLILVTHGSTIAALTGINPAPAEMVVLTPLGGGRFTVAGRFRGA